MSICVITGNHPRHKFLVNRLLTTGKITAWIIEEREEFVPTPPDNIDKHLSALFVHHFKERERIELAIFGDTNDTINIPILRVTKTSLNSIETIDFIKRHNPQIVLSYGCHKLDRRLIGSINSHFWNTHGGLSPQYRGVITHFWPSYFLEPQMTGMTLHETTNALDGGKIILQTSAPLVRGDTLHRLAARNVEHYAKELALKLARLDLSQLPAGREQKSYGRVFMAQDWRPEHLRLIYETYNDSIVDAVLDGQIIGREPELLSVV